MIENATIARPYARAMFEQAQEEGQLAQWSAMLKTLHFIVSDERVRPLLDNPKMSKGRLSQLILDIFDGQLSKTAANFVRILAASRRLSIVGEILDIFEDRWLATEGKTRLRVISAYRLTDSQIKEIAEVMSSRLKSEVEIFDAVDEALIGGAVIRFGDSVIDASIKGRLQKLEYIC